LASVSADEYLSAFVLNFNFKFSIGSGTGQTEFYFPTCTKPYRNTPIYFFEIQWTLLGFFAAQKQKKNRRITTVFAKNGQTIVT